MWSQCHGQRCQDRDCGYKVIAPRRGEAFGTFEADTPEAAAPKEKLGRLALLECDFAVEEALWMATQPQEPAEKRRHSERVMPQQRTVLRRFSFQELQLRLQAEGIPNFFSCEV
ncbi:unnamed protein product [Durusdinium trenchii]